MQSIKSPDYLIILPTYSLVLHTVCLGIPITLSYLPDCGGVSKLKSSICL